MQNKLAKMGAATADKAARHVDTLVLGAGISGLACASRLYQKRHRGQNKEHELLVLEGRKRIGGRIEAVYLNGCRLDTGANWIHGTGTEEKPNPLVGILPDKRCRELKGSVIFKAPESDTGQGEEDVVDAGEHALDAQPWVDIRPSSRTAGDTDTDKLTTIIPKDEAEKMFTSVWGLIGSLHEAAATTKPAQAKTTTMLQAIAANDDFRHIFDAVPKEYHRSISGMPQFIESMEAAPLAAQSAEHAADHPGMSLLEFGIDDFEGEQVFVQDGYAAVVDEVARDLVDAGLIRLGVTVQKVDWSKKPVRVETSDGVYTADQVVCTLPLGVLKHHHSQQRYKTNDNISTALTSPPPHTPLFEPPLPSSKQAAIHSLGFGTLNKIMLVYSSAWWKEEPFLSLLHDNLVGGPSFSHPQPPADNVGENTIKKHSPDTFFGFTTELPGIAIQKDGQAAPGPRALSLINLHNLTGFPVLSAFVSCGNAVQVEALSNEQAGELVHRALTSWLGGGDSSAQDSSLEAGGSRVPIPRPDAVHVSRWAQDEFSRGSYSHMITGISETAHREEFQKAIVNKQGAALRFAGEHTSRNHFATVHGALLSGWREADAILAGGV